MDGCRCPFVFIMGKIPVNDFYIFFRAIKIHYDFYSCASVAKTNTKLRLLKNSKK